MSGISSSFFSCLVVLSLLPNSTFGRNKRASEVAGRGELLGCADCLFLHIVLHIVFAHLGGDDVDFVLEGICVGLECDLMPFVAFQGVGIAHGPALAVLVDERLAVVAELAG